MQDLNPFLSVVVPTHGRPEQLARCLDALAAQDYPADRFSVIVVDDGSPDPPEEIIERFRGGLRIHLVKQSQAGPARARNAGAEVARGDLYVFTDDDCVPEQTWLSSLAAAHGETPDAALGGWTRNELVDNRYSAASQLLIDYLYSYYNSNTDSARFLTSNNLALPADAFWEIGGFAMGFPRAAGEDRDLCDRWLAHGRSIRLLSGAEVGHQHGLSLRSFVRQHFGYGRGGFEFQRARSQRGVETEIEPLRFYLDLVLYPFHEQGLWRAVVTTGLLLLTQAVNAAGFFWQRWLDSRTLHPSSKA